MMPLARCTRAYGHVRVRSEDPIVETHRDVLFDGRGLYDWRRRLIPLSAHFQGVPLPDRAAGEPLQRRTTDLDPVRVVAHAADARYLWGGRLTSHYGHFLTETLPRLWILGDRPRPWPRLVLWCDAPVGRCLALDFVREIFGALDLRPEDLLVLERPTRIAEIDIPAPGFESNSYVHLPFARFCRRIGAQLAPAPSSLDGQPIYFTKQNLSYGVARLTNEAAFTACLAGAGVRIVAPETLPFREQLALWTGHRVVTGYLGSAMHTALFTGGKRIACLNHERKVFSNQIMIDLAAGHHADYHSLADDLDPLGPAEGFHLNFRLRSPEAAAAAWLRVIARLTTRPPRGSGGFGAATIDPVAYPDEPFGRNLSRGRPADQSSIFPPHSAGETTLVDAARAVDGTRHDRYAFHTLLENNPWWQVDLGGAMVLHEVRIFNRLDIGVEHSRNFRILLSADGQRFSEVHRREGEPFGLPDGRPYRWRCERTHVARVVRIELLHAAYLHLRQVEVFGDDPEDG